MSTPTVPGLTPGFLIYSPKVRQSSVVRKQIGQYEQDQVGLRILDRTGTLLDPDTGSLTVKIRNSVDYTTGDGPVEPPVLEGTAADGTIIRVDVGTYVVDIGAELTSTQGIFQVDWAYQAGGKLYTYTDYYQVQDPMPVYSSLTDDEKGMVEQVSWMFGDLYDSTEGGPHLVEEFQTHFGFERIAQLMHVALNKINLSKQPVTYFTLGGDQAGLLFNGSWRGPSPSVVKPSPLPQKWYGLLVQGTYIEVIRHLMRSYTEQPLVQGLTVATMDRRDYLTRWQVILQDAQEDMKTMMIYFKRELLNLGGGGSLIVAGGLWGRSRFYGNTYSAEVRSYRMWPASFAAGFGLGH